jgi:hypothetical protein
LPARFRDIKRAVKEFGIRAEPVKGSAHWKLIGQDGRVYPLPCHNGERTEISDHYLRGLCRTFGIDLAELKEKL